MTTAIEKPHLSATQLDMYCRCPEAYRRRYVEGEIIPPGIALIKGSAFHEGAKENMTQKLETHTDMPADDIVDAAVAAFESAAHGLVSLTDEELSRGSAIVLGEAKDSLAEMAAVHATKQAPEYQPVLVEQPIRLTLPGPRDLLGIIDLADDRDRVIDFKTASRKKSQTDVDESVQLTVYAAAYRAKTGREASEVRLDSVVAGKRGVSRQVVTSSRGAADFSALAARINAVSQGIEAGVFVPAAPGSWWCSPRFCGYFNSGCPFVNAERKALAEKAEET